MPSSVNVSTSTSGTPGHPTHAPLCERRNGASALTSPPGLCFHRFEPSGSFSRSTGSRLATTMKSAPPPGGFWVVLSVSLSVVVTPGKPPSEPVRTSTLVKPGPAWVTRSARVTKEETSQCVRVRMHASFEPSPRRPQRAGHPRSGQPAFEPAEAVADGLGEVLPQHHARGERERHRRGEHERGQATRRAFDRQLVQRPVGGEA